MKQSRKIRRCWLRNIPEWMRCFARSVVRAVKAAKGISQVCRRIGLIGNCVKAHTKEWAAAMLAAGLIAAPVTVDLATGGWQLAAVNAAPEGGVVVGGAAQISAAGNVTTISQTSARAAIDWASFDIAKQETVTFQQPNAQAVALNRILGNNPTAIYGQLNANGQVYLSNPNGMLFAPGAQINVAGLIATTSHVDPLAFMQTGTINTSERNGAINMQGSIFANGGLVEIKGATAINVGGLIQATTLNGNGGVIALGNNARLDVNGASLFARGSDMSGDGGFIETSGDIIAGLNNVTVNAGSDNGNSGTWLIDPQDYNIGGANSDMSGVVLGNNLNTQNMIILSQSGTHAGLGDVNVVDAVSWTANNSLSLSAFRDVNVSANIVNTGTGSVTLQSDNTGIGYVGASASGGTVNFYNSATIGLLNADSGGYVNIYYNPGSYTSPNNYTANISAFTGHDTAYMLVNQLGAAADGVSIHSLAALSRHSSLWSDAFALGTNITATATSLWNTSLGFEPIGNATTKFSGKFDGLGNTLSDLFINRTAQCVGLFGYVEGANAMIGNLNLKDVRITGFQVNDAGYVGGVAGYNDSGTISNVTLSGGAIRSEGTSGGVYVGGLAGLNYAGAISGGSITDLVIGGSATSGRVYAGSGMGYDSSGVINAVTIHGGTITGSSNRGYVYVGGVAGYHAGTLSDVKITGTTFSGNSSGGSVYVGGVAGYNSGVTINNVTITGATLNGSNTDIGMICVGGVVGDNDSGEISAVTITDAIINASETGDGYIYAGGVAGFISAGTISNITISNSTISGSATSGGVYVGGAAGYKSNGVISAVTMNAATLSGTNVSGAGLYAGGLYVGGLVGYNNYGAVNGGDTRTTLSAGNIAVSYTSGGNVTVGMTGTTATIAQVSEGALTLAGVNVNRLTAGAAEFAINENLYVANDLALTAYGVGVTAGHIRFNSATATVGGNAYLTARPLATNATDLILATGGIFGTYSVYDYADLNNVRNDTSANAAYNQLANIDASGSANFIPIGDNNAPFLAKFDGLNNTIGNLTINQTASYVGLFGYISGTNATISNLILQNAKVTGYQETNDVYVGGVIGYNYSGSISSCVVSGGTINGSNISRGGVNVGGVIGSNYGIVRGVALSYLQISGSDIANGSVFVGGVAGTNAGAISEVSLSAGAISNYCPRNTFYVGGLAGANYGLIRGATLIDTTISGNSFNGAIYAGGIVGYNGFGVGTSASLDNINLTAVTVSGISLAGTVYVGGMTGRNHAGTISNVTLNKGVLDGTSTSNSVQVGSGNGYDQSENNILATLTAGSIDLVGDSIALTGTAASITQLTGTALTLGTSKVKIGGLRITATGTLTQSGALNVGETFSINAGANDVLLDNHGNDFNIIKLIGKNVTVCDSNELKLGASTVGSLNASAADFTINGNIDVANAMALNAYGDGVTAGRISINGATATVGGKVYLKARPLATNATDLILATGGIFGAYSVYDYADLNNLRNDLSVNAVYNQLANIDASGATDLVPIGNNTDKFLGKYAGNGNSISNLVINQTGQYVGLFGYVSGANATISNLNLVHANISGYQTSGNVFVGGIVGWNNAATLSGITLASSTISGSSSSGDVYGGGIAGRNIGNISDITLSAVTQNGVSVSGDVYSGGAAGYNDGAITGILVNDSAIKGSNDLTGSVTVGGAAGRNNGTIINVVLNNTTLSGDNVSNGNVRVGGAAGYNFASSLTVSNVQVNGSTIQGSSVDGDVRVGGIAGRNNSFINAVVVNGSTISGTNTTTGVVAVGGIAGENYALVSGGVISVSGATISARSESGASVKVGGFAGWNHDDIIGAVFNEGTISASAHASVVMVGGAVGHNNAAETISNVIISNTNISGNSSAEVVYLGGVAGNNEGTVSGGDTRTTLSAGNIAVNYTSSGNITVGMTGTAATITQVSEAGLTLAGANVSSGGLTVIATGTVTQSDMITVNGLTTVAAGDNNINLSNAANNFTGNFSASGGTIAVAAKTAFTVANISGSGTVLVNYTGIDPAGGITIANGGRIISMATASGTIATMMLNAGVGLFNNLGAADSIQAPTGRWQLYAVDENRITGMALTANAGLYYSAPAFDSANWSNIPRTNNRLVYSATHTPYAVDAGNNGYREYGEPNSTITNYYSIAALLPGDSAAAEVPLFKTAATTASGANVGYELTLTELVGAASDYNIAFALGVTDGTFAINKAPLTITAANKSKVYGTTDPVLTANYSGFKNSDTASAVSGFSMSTVTGSAATVGEHPIVASGGVAANYLISDVDGTLTVTPATEANAAEQARQAAIIAANQQNNAAGSSANQKQTTNQLTVTAAKPDTPTVLAGGLVSLTGVDGAIRLPSSEQSVDDDKVNE